MSLRDGRYPLARVLRAHVHRGDDAPVDRQVPALLEVALSDAGQARITDADGYLPLGDTALAEQRRSLAVWK